MIWEQTQTLLRTLVINKSQQKNYTMANIEEVDKPTNKIVSLALQYIIVLTLLLSIPFDRTYYSQPFNQTVPFFLRILSLINYRPTWNVGSNSGLSVFGGLSLYFLVSLPITILWYVFDKKFSQHLARWKYYLWVFLRIRLASLLVVYGLFLLFRLEAPYPTLSDLHTRYGYFLPWKIYYLSLGVSAAGYETTIGTIEILSAVLLLFYRTTFLGAGLTAFLFINIVLANFAYHMGDQVISIYILLLAIFVLAYNFQPLYSVLIKRKPIKPHFYAPKDTATWKKFRVYFRSIFMLLILSLAILVGKDKNQWPYPSSKGIEGIVGFYDVSSFQLDSIVHPYSQTDSIRWVDVIFEKWNTLSVHYNHSVNINTERPGELAALVGTLNYENSGNGDREFYEYTFEPVSQTLNLKNKNNKQDSLKFHFSKDSSGAIILKGNDLKGKSLVIALSPIDKSYLLHKGRRKPVSIF